MSILQTFAGDLAVAARNYGDRNYGGTHNPPAGSRFLRPDDIERLLCAAGHT